MVVGVSKIIQLLARSEVSVGTIGDLCRKSSHRLLTSCVQQ